MTPNYQPPSAWICVGCGRQNQAFEGVCQGCGAGRSVLAPGAAAGVAQRRKRSKGMKLFTGGLFAIFWLCFIAGFASPKACATIGGPTAFDEAMVTVRQCNKAKTALGDDIGPALTGCTSGTTRTGGGSGSASWNTTIEGTKGKGSLSWSARKEDGKWTITRASLNPGTGSIDVLQCASSGSSGSKKGSKASSSDD